ncbi:hypothetical protein NKH18_02575 [Streptomyces sp. M10(2022)]
MELSAILTEWIVGARETHRLIQQRIEGETLRRQRVWMVTARTGRNLRGMEYSNVYRIDSIKGDVSDQLEPKVSLVKNLTPSNDGLLEDATCVT